MTLTELQKMQLRNGLLCWANYIETGNVNISKHDAKNRNLPVNPLTTQLSDMVCELHKLAGLISSSTVIVEPLTAPGRYTFNERV